MSGNPFWQVLQGLFPVAFRHPRPEEEQRWYDDERRALYEEQWRWPPSMLLPHSDWQYWIEDGWRNRK